jgi:hypothetical protein
MNNELYLVASCAQFIPAGSIKKVPKNDTRKYKTMGNPNTETAMRYRE